MIIGFSSSVSLDHPFDPVEEISDSGDNIYVDPVCFNADYKYDKSSDIYSLGLILWKISSGKIPHKRNKETPVNLTPIDYKELYENAWCNDSNKRTSIEEVVRNLEDINIEHGYQDSDYIPNVSLGRNNAALKNEACLFIIKGLYQTPYLFLTQIETFIGRSVSNHIVIKDQELGKEHAKIKCFQGKVKIFDLGSESGIYVNDKKLEFRASQTLEKDDLIKLGKAVFQYLPAGEYENRIDKLLPIYNTAYLKKSLKNEFVNARENKQNLSLLFFDLDHFGNINKQYSHEAGDYALKELAELIQNKYVRPKDIFARYGGEEFTILLNNTNVESASEIAETIRVSVETHLFIFNKEKISVTLSIGVSEMNSSKTSTDLLNHADEACRKAKENGRNRVIIWQNSEDINILLLGETGVGKSTFINAFVNYLKFDTLNEAKDGDMEVLITSKFGIMDDNYNMLEIKVGVDDENELVENVGMSATQGCKSYVFPVAEYKIRLIDTPGIGDIRGIDQDKINFDNILKYIGQYGHLNGICIFLKPNNARLSVVFRFCIQELLSHFHKNAKDNIVFCFTNTRSTFYRSGDTLPALKQQLNDLKERSNVGIITILSTVYCFDNESFRFLSAVKEGVSFANDDEERFNESWKRSVNESSRLLKYLVSRTPHKVKDTISLNNARNIVILLSKLLAEIGQLIQTNISLANRQQDDKKSFQDKERVIIENYRTKIDNLKEQKKKITDINVKFAQFLQQNAIAAFNDAYADYLDLFISEEKMKKMSTKPDNYDDKILKALENSKRAYSEEITAIKKAFETLSNNSPGEIANLDNLEQQLYTLPLDDQTLKKIKERTENAQSKAFKYEEKHYNLTHMTRSSNKLWNFNF